MTIPHSKAELLKMNKDPQLGINWIINIENIGDTQTAIIYPTWDARLGCGRIYIALPEDLIITAEVKKRYNLL
jgi:hypothetical protein